MSLIEIEDKPGVKLSGNVDGEKRFTSEQLQQLDNPEFRSNTARRIVCNRPGCPARGVASMRCHSSRPAESESASTRAIFLSNLFSVDFPEVFG